MKNYVCIECQKIFASEVAEHRGFICSSCGGELKTPKQSRRLRRNR